jgi:hypothetical protein
MYKKNYQVLRKVFFNEFKYFSFIISLIIVSLVTFTTNRLNTAKLTSNIFSKQIFFDNYSFNNKQDSSKQLIFVDIKNLIEVEILENLVKLFSYKSDIFFNINEKIVLNKLNFKFEEEIIYDLDKKNIQFTFSQSYSFYNYQRISHSEINKLEEIIESEINKIINKHNLKLINHVKILRIDEDLSITYKVISSILFLTFFINLIFSLIKYRKDFF